MLVTLFTSFGRRPRRISATECPPVGSEDFVRAIAHTVNGQFVSGGTADLLNNGVRFFPAMFEAIRGAKQSINFVAYIWKPGKVSDDMFAALTERARAGVQVRVLLDGMGGIRAPKEGIAALRAAGGKVERFRALRFGKITVLQAHHRRASSSTAPGLNGGRRWGTTGWATRSSRHWRDCMVKVTGPLAAACSRPSPRPGPTRAGRSWWARGSIPTTRAVGRETRR